MAPPPSPVHSHPRWHSLGRWAAWLALATGALPALALTPPRTTEPNWQPPSIRVPADARPIELRNVRIDTEVFAGQAQSRIELRLYNPNPRVLEGELQFPLLDGQAVTGFALDVNGQLRDAVPVPKARGQEIFEDIRRRRVDPGLLEATAGNQYKLRVYPIPALGERRVQLVVTESLAQPDGQAMLRVPLVFSSAVGQLQVQVRAAGLQPQDVELVRAPAGTAVEAGASGATVRLQKQGWRAAEGPQGWLQLALRSSSAPQVMVGESAGTRYFAGQLAFKDEPVRRPEPSHIALVWDASGSAAAQLRVLPLLDTYFRSLRQPVQVSLLVVRNQVAPVRRFTVAHGQWDELRQALRAEPFDGSSNFDTLPVPEEVDATLLVSDGLTTDGQREIGYWHAAPLFALNAATAADVPRLSRIAERSGGAMVDVGQLGPDAALRALQYHGWRIEKLDSLAAERLVAPSLQVRDGRLAVAGELTDDDARVELRLVHPDGGRRTLALDVKANANARSDSGRWPAQQWARWRSVELADRPHLHRNELQQIAAKHGLVGPNSSLIVLELPMDYARYGLPAPPELADAVARLRQAQSAQTTQERQARVEDMVRQFSERQQWWARKFPKDKRPAEVRPQVADAGAIAGVAPLRKRAGPAQDMAIPIAPAAPATTTAPSPALLTAPLAESAPLDAARADVLANKGAGKAPAGNGSTSARIALQAWRADAPYLQRLQNVPADQLYAMYLDERAANQASSAFFMDVASLLFERGQDAMALRVLSNLAEMNLENRQLLRLYAYRLTQARQQALALPVLERVAELAPNEPQSWRDLGLALAETGQRQRAVDALWEVVSRPWNSRFAGIGMIALAELNAIAAQAEREGRALDLSRIDPRLRRNLPVGLRVVLAWDMDDTDIDLWVTDPNDERAFFGHRLTHQGGAMSPDATGGYGPEEFVLKQPKPGTYRMQAQFYGHRQQVLSGATTLMARITTGFGTAAAKDEWLTLRLTGGGEMVPIGAIRVLR